MSDTIEVKVPDIGDFKDVPVIEVFVKAGDEIKPEDSLISVESDKATMDVPSPVGGVVKDLRVKVGDKVSEGSLVLVLEPKGEGAKGDGGKAEAPSPKKADAGGASKPEAPVTREAADTEEKKAEPAESKGPQSAPQPQPQSQPQPKAAAANAAPPVPQTSPTAAAPLADDPVDEAAFGKAHASPSVRRLARELGVDLSKVNGTGPKSRILREDVQGYVKGELSRPRSETTAPTAGGGLNVLPLPVVDFAKFGPVETRPLSRIKKLSGANLHRNWVTIPHITQHDEADITDLEEFRKAQADEAKAQGVKLTVLAVLMKAAVAALRRFPEFNASLAPDGESLVLKNYFHIGVAVDTPNGLVVPVIRDVDRKGLIELARELGQLSGRMRDGKISPTDLQGGCFSISSLGGIGGTHFTPIINAPEVAILGVGRSTTKPVWNGREFAPRLMLPLSLSYDHRVIDGAAGARFSSYLVSVLSDIRRLVL